MARTRSSPRFTPLKHSKYFYGTTTGSGNRRAKPRHARVKSPLRTTGRHKSAHTASKARRPLDDDKFFNGETAMNTEEDDVDTIGEESSDGEDWDDEKTLVSKLMGPQPDIDEAEIEMENLLEGLRGSMGKRGRELKQDLVEVMVPLLNKVKYTHGQIERGPERRFREGTQKFKEASMPLVAIIPESQDELAKKTVETRDATIDLVKKLKEAYMKKNRLRFEFREKLQRKAKETLEHLDRFDELAKALEKDTEKKIKVLREQEAERNLAKLMALMAD